MRKYFIVTAALVIAALSGGRVEAAQQRQIPGYGCMMLNLTEQQSMDPSVRVPVRVAPSRNAKVAGWAGAVVVVKKPLSPIDGFVQMLMPNGRTVWIAATALRPYNSLGGQNARCVPMQLPNGLIGFGNPS